MLRLPMLFVLAAVFAAGCTSTYDKRFSYMPRPVEVAVATPGGGPAVQTLATIIGVRNANEKESVPRSIETRLRLENMSAQPVRFDPASLQMFSADLKPFGRPILDSTGAFTIEPRQIVTLNPLFPMPDGPADINGVNLRFTVEVAGQLATASATFTRQQTEVYYADRPRFSIGVGSYHRW